MIVRWFLTTVALVCFAGDASAGALQRWNPSRAASAAEHDIAAGKIRFAYIGGRVSHAPGLPWDSYDTVVRYPRLAVGPQGCIQDDGYDVRAEYACKYNVR